MTEKRLKSLFIFVGALFMVCFCIIPFGYMIAVSLATTPTFLSPKVSFVFTLANYSDVLGSQSVHFLDYLKNSLVVSSVSALLCVVWQLMQFHACDFPPKGSFYFLHLQYPCFRKLA
jgi:multiple sugar transport system permease protein